jgi:fructokinase
MTMTTCTTPINVMVAGEALVDLVMQPDGQFSACLGGASFNLTRALARQDTGVAYLNPLSSDRFGMSIRTALTHEGVFITQSESVPQPTSLAVVHLDEGGHPEYAFYRQGVADRALTDVNLTDASEQLRQIQVVCVGCLALAPEDSPLYLPWLADQRQRGRLVMVDINMRPSAVPQLAPYRANVLEAVRFAHIIKASDEDLHHLGAAGDSPKEQARWLLSASGAQLLLLTLGDQGAGLLFHPNLNQSSVFGRERQDIQVADTIGCGDSFLAGFLASFLDLVREKGLHVAHMVEHLSEQDKIRLLLHALATASINVMRTGCNPPTRSEVLRRLTDCPAEIV